MAVLNATHRKMPYGRKLRILVILPGSPIFVTCWGASYHWIRFLTPVSTYPCNLPLPSIPWMPLVFFMFLPISENLNKKVFEPCADMKKKIDKFMTKFSKLLTRCIFHIYIFRHTLKFGPSWGSCGWKTAWTTIWMISFLKFSDSWIRFQHRFWATMKIMASRMEMYVEKGVKTEKFL